MLNIFIMKSPLFNCHHGCVVLEMVIFSVISFNVMSCHKVKEGTVRLVGGKSHLEGNVQVYHLGRWGLICDDEFGPEDGAVICRQLGRSRLQSVTTGSYFGRSKKKFWMDNVWCSGYETAISNCRFDGWGEHDCEPDEAAGVICEQVKAEAIKQEPMKPGYLRKPGYPRNPGGPRKPGDPRKSAGYLKYSDYRKKPATRLRDRVEDRRPRRVKIMEHFGPFTMRLVGGGRERNEGRVEIKFSHRGQRDFGPICGDGWSLLEASLVCQHLNLGYARAAPTHPSPIGNNLALYHVKCNANTTNWQQCTSLIHSNTCPDGRIAAVVCTRELPDLEIDWLEIERSIRLEDKQLYYLQCAMEENCLATEAYRIKSENIDGSWYFDTRRLLRFTAKTTNIGNVPFRPFIPKHLWKYHQCHLHYHSMEVFATFDILDRAGNRVAQGHKASFCLEDNECNGYARPQYACANFGDQGISPNCSDIYRSTIDCQWIDITELNPGLYTFKVTINPEFKVPEQRYDNNAVSCTLYYVETYVKLYDCKLQSP
uniref:Lysyl oxidase homolog 2 n=1 Tax=Cacopsylla melanoneura TaxID=428564 RepID=A0A8D9AQY5_9HEMI